nr:MAG TPA: hypothetical protein [Caudoviricetes sp.]
MNYRKWGKANKHWKRYKKPYFYILLYIFLFFALV